MTPPAGKTVPGLNGLEFMGSGAGMQALLFSAVEIVEDSDSHAGKKEVLNTAGPPCYGLPIFRSCSFPGKPVD
jgi:hypothetical protein